MLLWFLPLFLILIMIGLPVVFALLASPFALILLEGDQRNVVAGLYRNLYNGMDSFPLMALPFFMLAGEMMNRGGITIRLVEFSQALMGHLRGGLAHVNPRESASQLNYVESHICDSMCLCQFAALRRMQAFTLPLLPATVR